MLRLFLKFIDIVVFIYVHDAEPGGLFRGDLQNGDGTVRPGGLVLGQHLGVVHAVDMVARENEDILGIVRLQEADVLIDGVGSALVPGALFSLDHIGGEDVDAAVGAVQIPGLAVAYVGVELQGFVLGEHAHGVNTGIHAVGQGEVDDAVLAAEGDGGLCHFAGQGLQPAALTAGQQHGHTFLFHYLLHPLIIVKEKASRLLFRLGGPLEGRFLLHTLQNDRPHGGDIDR